MIGHLRHRHELALGRVHAHDLVDLPPLLAPLLDLEGLDALETLAHVRLHRERVSRLPEDLEQVVVGEEVEAREGLPLGLKG